MALRFSPRAGASVMLSSTSRGPTGAAATIEIGTVTTLDPGEPATVTNSGTTGAAVFDFGIPQGTPGDMTGPGASIDGEIALFNGSSGTLLKRAGVTGILKATSGVLAAATAGSDYAPATSGSSILKGDGAGGFTNATAGTDYQAHDATLDALAAYNSNGLLTQTAADTFTARSIVGTANKIAVSNGDGVSGNPTIGVGSDILDKTATASLSAGYSAAGYDAGTISSGTFTPNEANGNFQYAVNGGAHTLAPPTNNCSIVLQYTNDGSAGSVTTSGFTYVTGDTLSTSNGDDFFLFITKLNGFSHLHKQKLQ